MTEENNSSSGVKVLFSSSVGSRKSEIKVINNFMKEEEKKVVKKTSKNNVGNKSKGRATSADIKKRANVRNEEGVDKIEKAKMKTHTQKINKEEKENKENKEQRMKNYGKSLKVNNFVKKEEKDVKESISTGGSISNNNNFKSKSEIPPQVDNKLLEKKIEKGVQKEETKNGDSEREDRPKRNTFLKEDKKNTYNSNNSKASVGGINNQYLNQNQSSNNTLPVNKSESDANIQPVDKRTLSKPKLQKLNSNESNKSASKKKSTSKEKEVKILSAEEKIELMEKLIKNKEDEIIKDVQKEVIQKGKQANRKIEKKLKLLGEKNMLENIQLEIDNELAEKSGQIGEMGEEGEMGKQDEMKEMTNSHQEDNNIIKQSRRNNFSSSSHNRSKSTPSTQQKKTLKPQVNTLELFAQILQERRYIIGASKQESEVVHSAMPTEERERLSDLNDVKDQNNSFRKSHSEDKRITEEDQDFPFASRRNKRNQQEIHEFIMKKKREEKEKAIKLEKEINERNLKRLFELTKVYENQVKLSQEPFRKSHSHSKLGGKKSSKKFRSSSQKVKNDMFIGRSQQQNKSQLDDSSFVDPDEYYITLLESKNILTPAFNTKYSRKTSINNPTIPNEEPSNKKESLKDLPGFSSASHLSGFTKGSKPNFYKRIEEDSQDILLDDKHVYKSQTKENFLKFIEQKEKEVTIRTLDSNDLLSLKSNRLEAPNNLDENTGKSSSNPLRPHSDEIEAHINSNLNTGKFNNNDSAKPSQRSVDKPNNQILTEDNLNAPVDNIQAEVKNSESGENLPNIYNERNLEEFANLIKLANKKNVFYSLVEEIKLLMLLQHYELSFNYLEELGNVILSRNVVSAFNILKENAIIQNYHESFNYFCLPIKRTVFNRLKELTNDEKGISITEQEMEVYESYLNKLLQFPKRLGFNALKEHVMEIYMEDENELRELYSTGIICLFNHWKRDAFYTIGRYAFNLVEDRDDKEQSFRTSSRGSHRDSELRNPHVDNAENNSVIIHPGQSPSPSKMGFEKEVNDEHSKASIDVGMHANNEIVSEPERVEKIEIEKDKSQHSLHSHQSQRSNPSHDSKSQSQPNSQHSQSGLQLSKNKITLSNRSKQSNTNRSVSNLNNGSFVSDQNGSFYKMHTFLYESLQSNNSSIAVYPNSLDSPHLHRIHELILRQKDKSRSEITDNSMIKDNKDYSQNSQSSRNNQQVFNNSQAARNKSHNASINSLPDQSSRLSKNQSPSPAELKIDPQSNSQSEEEKILNTKNSNKNVPHHEESVISISEDVIDISNKQDSKSRDTSRNESGQIDVNRNSTVHDEPAKILTHQEEQERQPAFNTYINAVEGLKANETAEKEVINEKSQNISSKVNSSRNHEVEESISEEIVEELQSKKQITNTENDISADRDNTSEIDWINTISHSKSSGSYRDVNINNNLNKNNLNSSNNFLDSNDSINKSAGNLGINFNNRDLKEIKEEKDLEEVSGGHTQENNPNTLEKIDQNDLNTLNSQNQNDNVPIKPNDEVPAATEEENNKYDDFIDEEIVNDIEEGKDFIEEIIKADVKEVTLNKDEQVENQVDSQAESQSVNFEKETSINNLKSPESPSINSFKSRNNSDKKREERLHKGRESGNISQENEVISEIDLNEKENKNINPADINAEIDTSEHEVERENIPEIIDPAVVEPQEKEINLDKITIESTDINREPYSKDKQSIESLDETGGYFVVKPSSDLKVYNLLDDKSSYNKSLKNEVLATPPYSDRDKQDAASNISYSISVNNKEINPAKNISSKSPLEVDSKEKTISINNQTLSVNKRYDNLLDENSARKTERSAQSAVSLSSEFEENLMKADLSILAEELTNFILEELLHSEIKNSGSALIPRKSFKSDNLIPINLNNSGSSFTSGNKSKSPMDDSVFMPGQGSLNNSIFMRSILDHKKETSLNLYMDKIAPKLVKDIGSEISNNYNKIVDQLATPYTSDSANLIQSLVYRDQNLLKKSFKILDPKNKSFLDKKTILSKFEKENKAIREMDNITSDNYYDNILNECMVEAAEEILNNERQYGELGQPLPWSNRTRAIGYKYGKNDISKKKMQNHVEKELIELANNKMGLIADNHEYLDLVQLNEEREKRLMNNIIKEVSQINLIYLISILSTLS